MSTRWPRSSTAKRALSWKSEISKRHAASTCAAMAALCNSAESSRPCRFGQLIIMPLGDSLHRRRHLPACGVAPCISAIAAHLSARRGTRTATRARRASASLGALNRRERRYRQRKSAVRATACGMAARCGGRAGKKARPYRAVKYHHLAANSIACSLGGRQAISRQADPEMALRGNRGNDKRGILEAASTPVRRDGGSQYDGMSTNRDHGWHRETNVESELLLPAPSFSPGNNARNKRLWAAVIIKRIGKIVISRCYRRSAF